MGFKGHAFKAGNIEIGKVNPNADLPLLSQEQASRRSIYRPDSHVGINDRAI